MIHLFTKTRLDLSLERLMATQKKACLLKRPTHDDDSETIPRSLLFHPKSGRPEVGEV